MRKMAMALALVATLVASQPAAALTVKFTSLTSPIKRGAYATAVVKTKVGARCSIGVYYKSGKSTAQGLGNKTVPSSGRVSWRWRVGTSTTPGSWPVRITCKKGSSAKVQRYLRVTR
jgi:hypothetical protein